MTARLLAYCLNSHRGLEFTKGISTAEEPDIWQHSDSGEIEHWIELGQPEEPRLRKACGRAKKVSVYAFGKSSDTWWRINSEAIGALHDVSVWRFPWADIVRVTELIKRTVKLDISIVGGTIYVDNGNESASIEPSQLMAS